MRDRRRAPARRGRLLRIGVGLFVAAAGLALPTGEAPAQPPKVLNIDVQGRNGAGVFEKPGRPCAEGGEGAYWHYVYSSPLAAGAFAGIPGELRYNLDLHSEAAGAPQASYSGAWLQGTESKVALENERGVMRLALSAGDCDNKTLAFDGTTVAGTGTWRVEGGDGSYRQATGSGTFTLGPTDVAPGADNPFNLSLNGAVDVLDPQLAVTVVKSYWGFLGVDYALRRLTVIFRVHNVGEGDAYGVQLKSVANSTWAQTLGPVPQKLGDLAPGEYEEIRIRYVVGFTNPPCQLVILGCVFNTTLTVTMPDALDQPADFSYGVPVKAPNLPPPLQ